MSIVPAVVNSPQVERGVEKLLSVQRPVVLAHIRGIRKRFPNSSPAQVIAILERRYLTAVTGGGAAVGASAAIPAVGVGISVALSAVETAVFLEASALFAQSVTEIHGIAVEDPERARTLVMAMMLGTTGSDLITQLAGQVTGSGPTRPKFWGELVTKSLPEAAMNQIASRVRKTFVRRFATTQSASVVGRAIPFGIGALIGGVGNNLLGRKVVATARTAFAEAPLEFPAGLEPRIHIPGGPTFASRVGDARKAVSIGVATAGRAIGSGASNVAGVIGARTQRGAPSRRIAREQDSNEL